MAGTINTTNYGFKKYAPEDTVSILQTFNGNMDGIDTAIKARQDENTVTAANVKKVEQGLTTVNEAINTTNNTVAAQNVQIQTNKQNITSQGVEINNLDGRVTALEDGGESIVDIPLSIATQISGYSVMMKKQGKHIFGNMVTWYFTTALPALTIRSIDNWAGNYPSEARFFSFATVAGNVFSLNNNVAHCIGSGSSYENVGSSGGNVCRPSIIAAVFDGVNTTLAINLPTFASGNKVAFTINIDNVE